ncbi:GNAT family N-acetyltransferase [Gillisia sp. M10.2A]|uniref:GNAT family N-acetyltransferase n=1 Tax=Gillisia lutea TaxID=2909668 RepID=A0ABS9EIP8_9FLAO|nr:GNAT family N-acetyltransferase [Gillisia lutea]MCF4102658.1 GNAT family N-acetyltransferase [Gillisia lutea]
MILIREIDYAEDVSEIIDLIHLGLSEKNTEASFLWKHFENPFGKSLGLLACDKTKIVGVRMFMFWEFKKGDKVVKAVRPVDTIIHPDYRGQGLFKDLTLAGLKKFISKYSLVFNTPNNNSLPGYIKMGWQHYSKELYFNLGIVLPSLNRNISIRKIENNSFNLRDVNLEYDSFRTHISKDFLNWRYRDSNYKIVLININEISVIVIYRIELLKGLKTLILIDYIGDNSVITPSLRKLAKMEKVFLFHYLDNQNIKLMLFKRRGKSVVVYRDDNFKIMEDIQFSSGDLEGRL